MTQDERRVQAEVNRMRWATRDGALEIEDLRQEGHLALARAYDGFDPSKARDTRDAADQFGVYAARGIRRGILTAVRRYSTPVRLPERKSVRAGGCYPQARAVRELDDAEPGALFGEVSASVERDPILAQRVVEALDLLPERYKALIVRRFRGDDCTFVEAAPEFGVTQQRIRQLEQKAFALLRDELEGAAAELFGWDTGATRADVKG